MQTVESQPLTTTDTWPADVRELFDSIEHAFPPILQRRKLPRTPYKRQGSLELAGETVAIYSRDANMWTVGFITSRRIDSNQRGLLRILSPDGVERTLRCRVIRSREIRPGWFDVGVEFPTEEAFAESQILNN
ncbi:MAG TPA: PilZ domain-containing protein [Tepidisphaeraceae bacterium]|jgi:hypothetical protein|nr:PilZ domain-containing protein [Tepidisphaeraceae bacterium]